MTATYADDKAEQVRKKCLTLLIGHGAKALDTLPRSQSRRALRSLEEKHLVKVAWIEGGDYEAARLTHDGCDYLIENPKLRNPIDWKWWIGTAIGVATLTVAIIALCIACTALSKKMSSVTYPVSATPNKLC